MDLIGQPCISSDFAVIGCASEQLYGMCEALWQPNLVRNNLKLDISLIIN
jgi:20S proteasome subunit beta 3